MDKAQTTSRAWDRNTRMPVPSPPAGSCDCQFHIYDEPDRFPTRPNPPYPPPDATFADARKMHRALGFKRGVIVHSAIYGNDHRLLLHALEGLPAEEKKNYRGIGIVDDRVDDRELQRLHAAGVRGARLNFVRFLPPDQPSHHPRPRPLFARVTGPKRRRPFHGQVNPVVDVGWFSRRICTFVERFSVVRFTVVKGTSS